jgi:DNA-binding response OmpR family regulator
MSRRIVIVEPDAASRAAMDRVLTADGYAVDTVAQAADAHAFFDRGPPIELAIVDEIGSRGAVLEDLRELRREHPAIPVIVVGSLLSARVMQKLLRLRVQDAVNKPFSPDELRKAVERALEGRAVRHDDALEYAAALEAAHRAIAAGRVGDAAPALRRAQATSPLDSEVTALWALLAELEGRDDEADRGYRAALALRHAEDTPAPDPYEGLSRLGAYGGARPVGALEPKRAGESLWLVTDPATELVAPSPAGDAPCVVITALGIDNDGPGTLYFRDGTGPRAFALMTAAMRPEAVASILARIGAGPIVASEPTRARFDLTRLGVLRGADPPR